MRARIKSSPLDFRTSCGNAQNHRETKDKSEKDIKTLRGFRAILEMFTFVIMKIEFFS